ncbi:pilus assembly protein PilM [Clostridium brassicae]|uniref:Pilus assembly protein PilM n=1 Tax=Clostridium brassicae TaxID=2999072 RepID=A0ABT4DAJ0_9CLOT|nr:pilus assembly protein PilM [Clostridium brassicae]MCY6959300.1 pilus assembly protein PilM [Clostridium brassicae]
MFDNKFVSFDIGTKNIKIIEARLMGKSKKIIVDKAVLIDTPENSFKDGKISDIDTIKEVIDSTLRKDDIKAKKAFCVSKSTAVINRIITLPLAKDKELEELAKYEIEQYLPINLDEYIVKYKKIEDFEALDEKMCSISVTVYPKNTAKGYWNLMKELKLDPMALDVSFNCIAKLLTYSPDTVINKKNYRLEETAAVIDLGHDFIELSIISGGKLLFTKILQGGGGYLDANIASQLFIEENDAEEKKIQLCDLNEESNLNYPEAEMIRYCAKIVVERWVRDIERMLDYFKNKNKDKTISKIYIYGGSSNIKGIDRFLENILHIPVEVINQINSIAMDNDDIDIKMILNAIGTIIRL